MKQSIAIVAVVASFAAAGWAAGPRGMGAQRGPDMQLSRILGRGTAFSATVVSTTTDAKGEPVMTMQNEMAMLDGKARFEIDMTKMQGGKGKQEDMSQMKSMGMDRQIVIAVPEKHVSYMIYPGMQAYVEMPMKTAEAAAADKQGKVERVELGKETVDGHPCIKTKRIITDEKGETFEALVWEATDLDNFPVQTQHQADKSTMTTLFKNINRAKPAASQFEVPQGFKKYDNMMQMMMGAAMKGGMPGGNE